MQSAKFSRNRILAGFFAGLGLSFGVCVSLQAQQIALSTVRGTAIDSSGAPVPKVDVKITNVATGANRSVTTNSEGDYEIPDLLGGTYRLTAQGAGFATFVADNIILESNQVRRIDMQLKVGSLQDSVTVNANAAVIETETGVISTGFTDQRYDENPGTLNLFYPGQTLMQLSGVYNGLGGIGVARINGHASNQIAECMDGVCDDGAVNQINNMEDVQEVKVFASGAPAEYSRSSSFDLVFKQGTNQLHGRAYWYEENSALNARDFFAVRKVPEKTHTFGTQVSGPIIKNKLFFFLGWDDQHIPSSSFLRASVPTVAMRGGDFSQLLANNIIVRDPLTGQPFPGNVIPQNRLNATSIKAQNLYYSTPNLGAPTTLVNNFGWIHPAYTDLWKTDYLTQRIDYKFSNKNTLYWRWINRFTPYYLPGVLPILTFTRARHHGAMAISDTHIISPTIVNTFRFGWLKDYIEDGQPEGYTQYPQPLKGADVVSQLGLTGVNPQGLNVTGSPSFSITGFTAISVTTGGIPQADRNLDYADAITWSKGRHVMKFGGDVKTFVDFATFGLLTPPAGIFGSYTFDGSLSGYGYADFLLGLPRQSTRFNPVSNRTETAWETGLFAQDTFKLSRRLNLDYGLRWEYFGAPGYNDGNIYNWDPVTGNIVIPPGTRGAVSPSFPTNLIKLVEGPVVVHPYRGNFRPRIGFAYRLREDTVIRGSYGQFTLIYPIASLSRYSFNQGGGPFAINETYNNVITSGVALFQFPNAFPAGGIGTAPSQSPVGYPLDLHNGVAHEFNVSIEHQFGANGVRVSYVGNRDVSSPYNLNINKPQPSSIAFTTSRLPFPQFVAASLLQQNGRTHYDSLQVNGLRKFGSLQFDLNWTWAHAMSNFLNLENPYNPNQWNQDPITTRHRVTLTASYDIPVGHGRRLLTSAHGIVDQVLGGWRLNYLAFLSTGEYFTPSFSGSDPSRTNTLGGIPDRICDGNFSTDQRSLIKWFDTSCFAAPPVGRFGNSGLNILQGPGYNTHNVSFVKQFSVTERVKLKFQTNISNIFNHPNFLNPTTNISVPSVGQITGTVGARDAEGGAFRRFEIKARLDF